MDGGGAVLRKESLEDDVICQQHWNQKITNQKIKRKYQGPVLRQILHEKKCKGRNYLITWALCLDLVI